MMVIVHLYREIELYKKLNKNKSVKWYNIYTDNKALKIINKSREECLKAFHVIDGIKYIKKQKLFLYYGKILNILKFYITYLILN